MWQLRHVPQSFPWGMQTGKETCDHIASHPQPGLERGGEGRTQMLHCPGRVGVCQRGCWLYPAPLMGPSKESGLGFHDNRQAASQGDSWVSSPNPYLSQESVLSMPAFLDPERAAVWVVGAHTCWCIQRPSSEPCLSQAAEGWTEGIRQSGELPQVFPVTSQISKGLKKALRWKLLTGQDRARLFYWQWSVTLQNVLFRAGKGDLTREQGRQ